jgi:hypothetical protein
MQPIQHGFVDILVLRLLPVNAAFDADIGARRGTSGRTVIGRVYQ